MLRYTLKRLLLIPPTFFMVSVVIFLVLNLAPGRPGEVGQADSAESRNSMVQRESYRVFKEQFALDRPILFNTRFALSEEEVRQLLKRAYASGEGAPIAKRIEAQERLEDYGNYLVRHLIAILRDAESAQMRRLAARQLSEAARRQLQLDTGRLSASQRRENRLANQDNRRISQWKWRETDSPETAEEIRQSWLRWWNEEQGRFQYDWRESIYRLFLDTRFARYWANLVRLDFGLSTVDRRPVWPVIVSKLKYSLTLTLIGVLLAYLIAIPIGIFSAVRQNTATDAGITVVLFVLYSLPTFFTGTVLLRLFSEGDPVAWFPTGGFSSLDRVPRTFLEHIGDVAWHLVLPMVTYAAAGVAALSRYARAGLIDVIRADYVRTARAKGLREIVVIVKHAGRNGMIPILTLLGSLLPALVSGSVVIEVVFGIPGMGQYLYDAINLRDYNAVMGVLVMASGLTLLGILISDLSYAVADPRITFD